MKNIFAIFKSDLKGVCTHFFVLVVTLGVCALPALYAWFNIYANWDPYANTGNIKIAVAIEDEGWSDDDGNYWNLGEEVLADLKKSTAINWVFTDTDEAVQEGVRSGSYYAGITLGADFSRNMFSNFSEKTSLPEMNYYLNAKKNAVAAKITDTAVENVQNNINEKYVSITTGRLYGDLQENVAASEAQTDVQKFVEKLNLVRENLLSYKGMIDTFMESNTMLSGVLESASGKLDASGDLFDQGSAKLSEGIQNTEAVKTTFNDFSSNVTNTLYGIQDQISTLASQISAAQLEEDAEAVKARINEMVPIISELQEKLNVLLDAVMALDAEKISWEAAAENLKTLQNIISLLQTNTTKAAAISAAEDLADSVGSALQDMSAGIGSAAAMFSDNLVPSMNQLIGSMQTSMNAMISVMDNLGSTVGTLSSTLTKMGETSNALNESLPGIQNVLDEVSDRITELTDLINEAAYSEQLELIMTFLSGDASALSNYFAEPVAIEDHSVYAIKNYGSGVAPFYTSLAIWVGMTILVSVLKVHPKKEQFPEAKRYEFFLGRYLLFLILSELQTAIIVIGELKVFKIQCLYPGRYFLAAAVASLTISLIVYSLTVSFGDIGKAVAIIALVIQIAGSGGTYPIEILPSFFRNIYLLFPFPHMINAMRECIGGMYDGTYIKCLLTLGIFCGVALVVGLLIRLPLIPLNNFVEERMEDTKLM